MRFPSRTTGVDLVVTSPPPYWKKRDYGVEGQIGQEKTAQEFVDAMVECLQEEWRRVLRRTESVFLNIGDSFQNRRLAGIPARVELAAGEDGWIGISPSSTHSSDAFAITASSISDT